MKFQTMVPTIKDLVNKNQNKLSLGILVLKIATVIAIFALIPVGTAKSQTYKTRVSFNQEKPFPITLADNQVQVSQGIAKADIDRLNETADPELVKKLMQELAPEYGVDWKLVYAIGYHESGNYSSTLARNNNNFFGRKASSTGYASWSTPEEGIRNQFEYLKTRYFDRGLTTPETINPVYAEDGSWKYAVQGVMNTL